MRYMGCFNTEPVFPSAYRKINITTETELKRATVALNSTYAGFPKAIVLTTKPRIDTYVHLHQNETWW